MLDAGGWRGHYRLDFALSFSILDFVASMGNIVTERKILNVDVTILYIVRIK